MAAKQQCDEQPKIPRRRKQKVDANHPEYELDVWLAGSDPLIWRSLVVPADITPAGLHNVIQAVMPWESCHLYAFRTRRGQGYSPSIPGEPGFLEEIGAAPDTSVQLRDLFEDLKETLIYIYDMGDGWEHGIKLIDTHADASAFEQVPMCLDGANNAPPEDCGGIPGFYQLLEALTDPDPNDEWQAELAEMYEGYDPARFDREAINRSLGT